MNERIKQLRKAKKMTQVDFGKIIGLSQKAVSVLEEVGGTVTERNFNTICEKFSVNPEWLRHGEGKMFLTDSVDAYIDKVVAEKKLTPEDRALIKTVIDLPPQARKAFIDWAIKLVDSVCPKPNEREMDDEYRELEQLIDDTKKRLAELEALKAKKFSGSP